MRGDETHNLTAACVAAYYASTTSLVAVERMLRRNGATTFADVYVLSHRGHELIVEVEMRASPHAVLNAWKALVVGVDQVEIVTPTRRIGNQIRADLHRMFPDAATWPIRLQVCGYYLWGPHLGQDRFKKCEKPGFAGSIGKPGFNGGS